MEFGWLRVKDICLISAITALGAILLLFAFFSQSDWSYFVGDFTEGVVPIHEVHVVKEFPLSDVTLKNAISGSLPASMYEALPLSNYRGGSDTRPFTAALHKTLGIDLAAKPNLLHKQFAILVRIPADYPKDIKDPMLYMAGLWSRSRIYVDGTLVAERPPRSAYTSYFEIRNVSGKVVDFLFVFDNSFEHTLAPFNLRRGLSIRPAGLVDNSIARFINVIYAPIYFSAISFLIIGILALTLAFSSPRFLDVWAFALFCLSWAMCVWLRTPAYYIQANLSGSLWKLVHGACASLFVCSAALMTLAFFRLEGRHLNISELRRIFREPKQAFLAQPLRLVMASVVLAAGVNLLVLLSSSSLLSLTQFNTFLAYLFPFGQIIALGLGFRALLRARSNFVNLGLHAQATIVMRRLYLSLIYAVGILIMAVAFATFFQNVNSGSVSSDLLFMFSIFPALGMLVMLATSTQNASKVYSKLAPRLDQVDQEVIVFGEAALARKYAGALFVFDVAGMRHLTIAEARHPVLLGVVSKFLTLIESDLGELLQRNQTTFRYKSNGDEFIFLMYAKDSTAAKELLVTLTHRWAESSQTLIIKWRAWLAVALGAALRQADAQALSDHVDIHVLACSLSDISITIKGSIDRPLSAPDFIDRRFTLLTTLFKESRHDSVAMYADDVVRVIGSLKGTQAGYAPVGDTGDMGFLRLS